MDSMNEDPLFVLERRRQALSREQQDLNAAYSVLRDRASGIYHGKDKGAAKFFVQESAKGTPTQARRSVCVELRVNCELACRVELWPVGHNEYCCRWDDATSDGDKQYLKPLLEDVAEVFADVLLEWETTGEVGGAKPKPPPNTSFPGRWG